MRKPRTLACYVALLTGLGVGGCADWSFAPPIHGYASTKGVMLAAAKAGAAQSPSNFAQYLAGEYVALATNLDQLGDTADADYFARKALETERGSMAIPPENNSNWAIPLETPYGFRTQLAQARARLVAALDGGARDRAPALAARAQARYDCWAERMEDDWQHAQNGPCRSEFLAAMGELEGKPAVASAPAAAAATVIDVYFDFNKSGLTREGQQIVQQIATQLKANSAATVTVTGKTDLAGTDSYNLALSKRRAASVRAELIRDGIAVGRITVQWTGKRQPPVKTADGVREPRNRVVEVVIR